MGKWLAKKLSDSRPNWSVFRTTSNRPNTRKTEPNSNFTTKPFCILYFNSTFVTFPYNQIEIEPLISQTVPNPIFFPVNHPSSLNRTKQTKAKIGRLSWSIFSWPRTICIGPWMGGYSDRPFSPWNKRTTNILIFYLVFTFTVTKILRSAKIWRDEGISNSQEELGALIGFWS